MTRQERLDLTFSQALETPEGREAIKQKLREVYGHPFTDEEMLEEIRKVSPQTARRYAYMLGHDPFEMEIKKEDKIQQEPETKIDNVWDSL